VRAAALLLASTLAAASEPARAQAGELVMFQSAACPWCALWDREVGGVYDRTEEARLLKLRRVDAERERTGGVQLAQPVEVTPTFVIVACGRELGRITGYPGDDHFWGLLGEAIGRHRRRLATQC
jgi:thioredoxin-related protein